MQVLSKVCTLFLSSAFILKAENVQKIVADQQFGFRKAQLLTFPTWIHLKEPRVVPTLECVHLR